MKIVFSVTILDGNIELAEKFVEQVRANLLGAEVRIFSAPKGIGYSVESPMVEAQFGSDYRREYGRNGYALIDELCSQRDQIGIP